MLIPLTRKFELGEGIPGFNREWMEQRGGRRRGWYVAWGRPCCLWHGRLDARHPQCLFRRGKQRGNVSFPFVGRNPYLPTCV
jgi:hypothetical protein